MLNTGIPKCAVTSCAADSGVLPRSMRSSAVTTPTGVAPATCSSATD